MSIRTIRATFVALLVVLPAALSNVAVADEIDPTTSDSLYREIQRTVAEADFEGMSNTYHADAVVVTDELTHPVTDVIERWKAEGEAFKLAGGQASVDFRFSSRLKGPGTSFDTGIFRYRTIDSEGVEDVYYTHFENLAIRKEGTWRTIMEHQTHKATEAEWDELPAWP